MGRIPLALAGNVESIENIATPWVFETWILGVSSAVRRSIGPYLQIIWEIEGLFVFDVASLYMVTNLILHTKPCANLAEILVSLHTPMALSILSSVIFP